MTSPISTVAPHRPSAVPGFARTTDAQAHAISLVLAMPELEPDPGDGEAHARAFMALLERPFVHATTDQELLADLQRRYAELRDWYASRAQWRVERTVGSMRLRRIVDQPLASHGLVRLETAAEYELLCLTLYHAEGLANPRFRLSGLTAAITRETLREDGTPRMPWTERQHRASLKRVLEVCARLGVLHVVQGDMEAYVAESAGIDGEGGVEALLERGPQFRLFATHLPEWLTEERVAPGDPASFERVPPEPSTEAHHRLYRALLTGPACYRDLDPEAFALLEHEDVRAYIAQDLFNQFDCALEITRDYAALVRRKSERNRGQTFPERNDLAMLVLLAANTIRAAVADPAHPVSAGTAGRVTMDRSWFADCLQQVRDNDAYALGTRIRSLGRTALAAEAIRYLETAGVAVYDDSRGMLTLLPAFARVVGEYDTSAMATRPDRGAPDIGGDAVGFGDVD